MSAWLVVGLGNPGPAYATTRHNLGAMTVAELAKRTRSTLRAHKARAALAQVRLGIEPGGAPGPAAVLAVPSGFMNESGGPVKALCQFFGVAPERLRTISFGKSRPFEDGRSQEAWQSNRRSHFVVTKGPQRP